ncbi:MAG: hypothetical protein V6Z86_05685 [Hyphomicrobiales bacterium]
MARRLKVVDNDGPDMSVLNKEKPRQGLTPNQEALAQALYRGATNIEAYREAYNVTTEKKSTIYPTAHRVSTHPKVVARVWQLGQVKEQAIYDEAQSLTDFILEETRLIACDTSVRTQDRLKALELLGKTRHVQLFKDTVVTENDTRTSEQILNDIKKSLEEDAKSKSTD